MKVFSVARDDCGVIIRPLSGRKGEKLAFYIHRTIQILSEVTKHVLGVRVIRDVR